MVFTTRFAGGRGGRNALEAELRRRNVEQKNSRPNKPTTCGKVERFQQTLKRWLGTQPHQPTNLVELQQLLDQFVAVYNHQRPHRSLPGRGDPGRRLPGPPQSHSRRTPRHPRPRPARPHRHRRQGHPAGQRPPPPHRHRPNPRPNPRPAARPRPPGPRRQRGHRRAAARAGHRPRPQLPAHPPIPHQRQHHPEPTLRVRGDAYLLRDHNGAPRGIRTPNRQIRRLVLYVHAVVLSAVGAAQVRCRIQLGRPSPVW